MNRDPYRGLTSRKENDLTNQCIGQLRVSFLLVRHLGPIYRSEIAASISFGTSNEALVAVAGAGQSVNERPFLVCSKN